MKTVILNAIGVAILYITLIGCNRFSFKPGIYSNKLGEQLKFNLDSTFEFHYYGQSKLVYSSGLYYKKGKKIHIQTDSANLPVISSIALEKSANKKIILDDGGYVKRSRGALKFGLVINDSMLINSIEGNEFTVDETIMIRKIRVIINSYPKKDVYGPEHNTPIFSNEYYIPEINSTNRYTYSVKLLIDTRMFYVDIFNTDLRITKGHLFFPNKSVFFYCTQCRWNKSSMTSPAMDR